MALVDYGTSDEDIEDIEDVKEIKSQFVEQHNLFAELPAPKSSDDLLDEPEMIVEPTEKELSLREKPPQQPAVPVSVQKKKKLIQLPSLPFDDSDEEEEKQTPFMPSSSKGSLNLFDCLPKPKYCSTKEVGRTLLPHVLTKQKESYKKPQKTVSSKVLQTPLTRGDVGAMENSKKAASHGLLTADYVSDDENDSDSSKVTNYFSICSANADDRNAASERVTVSLAPVVDSQSEAAKPRAEEMTSRPRAEEMTSKPRAETTSEGYSGAGVSPADAPLKFRHTQLSDVPLHIHQAASNSQPDTGNPMNADYSGDCQDVAWQAYQTSEQESIQYPEYSANQEVQDQFQNRFGKKRKRGQEDIQVIEVNLADHLTGASLERTKSLTIQKDVKSHSKKRNKDLPTSQQKRKHQITFLAHQAKERELELKNQWAENKFSKKQTQSKYGF